MGKAIGGLLKVIGGLLIFASWITEKAIRDRYHEAKKKIDRARERRDLYEFLATILNAVSKLDIEIEFLKSNEKTSLSNPIAETAAWLTNRQRVFQYIMDVWKNTIERATEASDAAGDTADYNQQKTFLSQKLREFEKIENAHRDIVTNSLEVARKAPNLGNEIGLSAAMETYISGVGPEFFADLEKIYDQVRDAILHREKQIEEQVSKMKQRVDAFHKIHIGLYFVGGLLFAVGELLDIEWPSPAVPKP